MFQVPRVICEEWPLYLPPKLSLRVSGYLVEAVAPDGDHPPLSLHDLSEAGMHEADRVSKKLAKNLPSVSVVESPSRGRVALDGKDLRLYIV